MTAAPEASPPDIAVAPAEPIEPQPGTAPEEMHATILGAVGEWLHSLRVAFARAVEITVLEARLAALHLTLIVIFAVASGLLLATAWITLFAAIAVWLHELGLAWSTTLLSMAVANLALAAAGGYAIYRMSNNLVFQAIRKFILYTQDDTKREENADS